MLVQFCTPRHQRTDDRARVPYGQHAKDGRRKPRDSVNAGPTKPIEGVFTCTYLARSSCVRRRNRPTRTTNESSEEPVDMTPRR
jgi:hypothetical protein